LAEDDGDTNAYGKELIDAIAALSDVAQKLAGVVKKES
jgi:hypothetical protein